MRHRTAHLLLPVTIAALLSAPSASANSFGDAVGEFLLRATIDVLFQGPHVRGPGVPVPIRMEPIELQVVIIPDPSVRMKDEAVSYRSSAPTDTFRVRDFSRTFVTAVGGSAKDASELAQQDQLLDPAAILGDDLAQAISRHYGGRYAGAAPATSAASAPSSAAAPAAVSASAAAPGAPLGTGFLVEVTTTHWEMKAVSINPLHIAYGMNHYGVYYDAKFRLVDRKDGSVLAAGKCDAGPAASASAPSYEEAMADGGKRIKEMLETAAHDCALSAEEEYLGIRMPARASDSVKLQ